jgi:ABC-type polysaccharide/polyol phosphate export permease
MKSNLINFYKELRDSINNKDFWIYSAKINTYKRYRRSVLGPWWLTLNLLIFVLSVGFIWSLLWKIDLKSYLPFFMFGMVFWELVSSTVGKSISVLKLNENLIKTINVPKLNFNFQVSVIVIINFFHNCFIIIPLGLILNFIQSSYAMIMIIPTLFLFSLNIFFLSIIISILSVRYKDFEMILEHIMRILFLITPIIWMPSIIPDKSIFLKANILYPYVEIFRLPLQGTFPTFSHYLTVILCTLILGFLSVLIFEKNKKKIVFWI